MHKSHTSMAGALLLASAIGLSGCQGLGNAVFGKSESQKQVEGLLTQATQSGRGAENTQKAAEQMVNNASSKDKGLLQNSLDWTKKFLGMQ